MFRRCPCCPDWNKSPGRNETPLAEPSPPSGLSGPLLYLRGCTGLRSPPDQLTELMDSWRMDVDLGAQTSPYHSLCFSPNKHHIVELRMGAPPFGLVVFAR